MAKLPKRAAVPPSLGAALLKNRLTDLKPLKPSRNADAALQRAQERLKRRSTKDAPAVLSDSRSLSNSFSRAPSSSAATSSVKKGRPRPQDLSPDASGYLNPEKKYTVHLRGKEAIASGIQRHFSTLEQSVKTLSSKKKQKAIKKNAKMIRENNEELFAGTERDVTLWQAQRVQRLGGTGGPTRKAKTRKGDDSTGLAGPVAVALNGRLTLQLHQTQPTPTRKRPCQLAPSPKVAKPSRPGGTARPRARPTSKKIVE